MQKGNPSGGQTARQPAKMVSTKDINNDDNFTKVSV